MLTTLHGVYLITGDLTLPTTMMSRERNIIGIRIPLQAFHSISTRMISIVQEGFHIAGGMKLADQANQSASTADSVR